MSTAISIAEPIDVDRELSRLNEKIIKTARRLPKERDRLQLAHELRELAKLIEEMP